MYLNRLLVLFSLLYVTSASATENLLVNYVKTENVLSLSAHQVPLSKVLASLSDATGLAIYMNLKAEQNISVVIKEKTLEAAIKRLLSDSNYIGYYESMDNGSINKSNKLVRIDVLPSGETDSDNLVPLSTSSNPAANRSNEYTRQQRQEKYQRIKKLATERNKRHKQARKKDK